MFKETKMVKLIPIKRKNQTRRTSVRKPGEWEENAKWEPESPKPTQRKLEEESPEEPEEPQVETEKVEEAELLQDLWVIKSNTTVLPGLKNNSIIYTQTTILLWQKLKIIGFVKESK